MKTSITFLLFALPSIALSDTTNVAISNGEFVEKMTLLEAQSMTEKETKDMYWGIVKACSADAAQLITNEEKATLLQYTELTTKVIQGDGSAIKKYRNLSTEKIEEFKRIDKTYREKLVTCLKDVRSSLTKAPK